MTWRTIELERRYAHPAHQPGWTGDNRPPWAASEKVRREFAVWASAQLDELQRRVRAEREAAMEPMMPEYFAAARKGLRAAMAHLPQRLADMRVMRPKATINDIADRERLAEVREASGGEGGGGRPASGTGWKTPTAKAAIDLWRLRKVILPRFWPEAGKGGVGPKNEALATIAAARHPPATASEALNWYKNERLASP